MARARVGHRQFGKDPVIEIDSGGNIREQGRHEDGKQGAYIL